jgi:hypothetical protein
VAPILVGNLVAPPHNDRLHWRIAFLVASGVATLGLLIFVTFAQALPIPELLGDDATAAVAGATVIPCTYQRVEHEAEQAGEK